MAKKYISQLPVAESIGENDVLLMETPLATKCITKNALLQDVNTTIATKANTSDLATVATSGSYNDLSDKPTIPEQYVLPQAGIDTLGGIKVGLGLSIDDSGALNMTEHSHEISKVTGLQDILDGKAALNHTHEEINSKIIKSIKDYEYLVTDDNDWTIAFETMAADIGETFNTLYIPYGEYNITRAIIFEGKSNISIKSDYAIIKNIVQNAANSTGGTFYFRNSNNISIEKVIHRGIDNEIPITALKGGRYGLIFYGCSDIFVMNNHFYDFGDNALLIGRESNQDTEKVKGCSRAFVDNCVFNNIWQTSTTTMGCESYHFTNNKIKNIYGSCKFAQRYDLGGQLIITGNQIEGAYGIEGADTSTNKGIEINNYKNIIISNNIIKNITGCVYISNNSRASDDTRYIVLENISIENNIFYNFSGYAVSLYNTNVTLEDESTILWNNIKINSNTINTNIFNSNGAIYVRGPEIMNLQINNNNISSKGVAVQLSSSKITSDNNNVYPYNSYLITNNNIRTTGKDKATIAIQTKVNCIIEGNKLETLNSNVIGNLDYISDNLIINSNIINCNSSSHKAIAISTQVIGLTVSNNLINSKNVGLSALSTNSTTWIKLVNNRFNTSSYGLYITGSGSIYKFGNKFNSKIINANFNGTIEDIVNNEVDLSNYATISQIPTSLPANGGNASTVNGISLSTITSDEYTALETKLATTLYIITDAGKIYLGTALIAETNPVQATSDDTSIE